MKNTLVIFLAIILLSSCKKDVRILPANHSNSSIIRVKVADTVPDGANLKIRLWTDSTNYDETEFIFRKTASASYAPDQDARYMQGYGNVSVASISADNELLAIYAVPYKDELTIRLNVESKNPGTAFLGIAGQNKIPPSIHVWLSDKYLHDTTDISRVAYKFNITADTNSFGNKRFQLILNCDSTVKKL